MSLISSEDISRSIRVSFDTFSATFPSIGTKSLMASFFRSDVRATPMIPLMVFSEIDEVLAQGFPRQLKPMHNGNP